MQTEKILVYLLEPSEVIAKIILGNLEQVDNIEVLGWGQKYEAYVEKIKQNPIPDIFMVSVTKWEVVLEKRVHHSALALSKTRVIVYGDSMPLIKVAKLENTGMFSYCSEFDKKEILINCIERTYINLHTVFCNDETLEHPIAPTYERVLTPTQQLAVDLIELIRAGKMEKEMETILMVTKSKISNMKQKLFKLYDVNNAKDLVAAYDQDPDKIYSL